MGNKGGLKNIMESLNQRLSWLRSGLYERGNNKITREFISQLLDEVIFK